MCGDTAYISVDLYRMIFFRVSMQRVVERTTGNYCADGAEEFEKHDRYGRVEIVQASERYIIECKKKIKVTYLFTGAKNR